MRQGFGSCPPLLGWTAGAELIRQAGNNPVEVWSRR
jgi:hypothetical protein